MEFAWYVIGCWALVDLMVLGVLLKDWWEDRRK